MNQPQVKKNHYNFSKYSHPDRWVSYFHQLREVLDFNPQSILEVGVGDKTFGSFLKNNTSISYTSVDVAPDLMPDVLGSVTSLPFEDKSFDVVCVFEVLEHLPYDDFDKSLKEIYRVSKKYVVISLPHFGPRFQIFIKIPLIPELRISWKVPFYKKHVFNGEHYWEIGKKGYSLNKIIGDLEKKFKVIKNFVPFESQYHHFFVLEKK
jgi:ubiquinone/menaquinone biosynthesis C-methylase UbiE